MPKKTLTMKEAARMARLSRATISSLCKRKPKLFDSIKTGDGVTSPVLIDGESFRNALQRGKLPLGHTKSKHRKKTPRKFECERCGRSFESAQGRASHRRGKQCDSQQSFPFEDKTKAALPEPPVPPTPPYTPHTYVPADKSNGKLTKMVYRNAIMSNLYAKNWTASGINSFVEEIESRVQEILKEE